MATTNESAVEEEEDVGALIYRESQLRKAEKAVAAVAAESKLLQTSTASAHSRTSIRRRPPVTNLGTESLPILQRKKASKMKRGVSIAEDPPRKKVAKKKYRYECSADGCTIVVRGGVCKRHGAAVKRYECSVDGCTNRVVQGGVCVRHGAKIKLCSCVGCTNGAVKGGVCMRHGAKKKQCRIDGCKNIAKKGGVCKRHGAYRNTQDESTAFGSEFDTTNAAQTLPNQRALRANVRGHSVPNEVIAYL